MSNLTNPPILQSTNSPIATAIFDWDGVIIDSHDQHERSWELLAEEQGKTLPAKFFKQSFGMRNQTIIPMFFSNWIDTTSEREVMQLADRKEQLYRDLVLADGIDPLPGVHELLGSLKAEGIPCSVGSSTPRANIDAIMEATGLAGAFDAITAAEDVDRGKPAPDVFLKAAEKVGGSPGRSVVFEDAHVGIEAAIAADMKVIAVATTHPIDELGEADLAYEDLTSVTASTLLELLA
jgi:beta-phosphoglucomutase family hydrolase